jgi:hypothetical protein
MTAKQITKKIVDAKISLANITIAKNSIEVFIPSPHGNYADSGKTKKLASKLCKLLGFGGYSCAHGGWVLEASPINMGDWNDRSSKHHY